MTTPSRPSRTSIDYDEVVRRLRAGERQKDLAAELGVSRTAIYIGATKRGFVRAGRGPVIVPTGRTRIIIERLRGGESAKQVAFAFGIGPCRVYEIVAQTGLSVKTIKRGIVSAELAADVEAVRNGASIVSVARDGAHQRRIEIECHRLGVQSKHSSRPPSKYLQAARVADAPQPEAM